MDQGGGTKAEAMGDIMEKRIKIFGTIECARKSQFKIALWYLWRYFDPGKESAMIGGERDWGYGWRIIIGQIFVRDYVDWQGMISSETVC